jgi:hypothetical protein
MVLRNKQRANIMAKIEYMKCELNEEDIEGLNRMLDFEEKRHLLRESTPAVDAAVVAKNIRKWIKEKQYTGVKVSIVRYKRENDLICIHFSSIGNAYDQKIEIKDEMRELFLCKGINF